jgi:O-antigen biosynthesis protein
MLVESLDVAIARPYRLVGDAIVAVWDKTGAEPSARLTPQSGAARLPRPHATFLLPTSWGGTRVVMALRWPAASRDQPLAFHDETGAVARVGEGGALPFDAAALVNGLTLSSRARLAAVMLEFCHAAFARPDERRFAALCRACLAEIAPDPAVLVPVVTAADGLVLCEGALPAGFGPVQRGFIIDRTGLRPLPLLPLLGTGKANATALHVMVDATSDEPLVALFGESGGLACRVVRGKPSSQRLVEWLERRKPAVAPSLRDYVARGLATRAGTHPQAAAVLDEMQLLAPLARKGVFSKNRPVGAEIDLALSTPGGGLFVAGWLHDPHAMVAHIDVLSPLGQRRTLTGPLHRFPRADVAEQYGDNPAADRSGFVTWLAEEGTSLPQHQHRFELHLQSGAMIDVVAPMPPVQAADSRNAVLGCLPPAFATPQALATCIAPAAAALHAAHMATRQPPDIIHFGSAPSAPVTSVVVPLYRVLDFLRFQIAAFAVDPALQGVELIYVLDSPEQRHEVEHLLLGLHALYALPMILLVMSRNYGFSAACNAGAQAARGEFVLFLNSDVIPDRPGWLEPLQAVLAADADVAAVGPKLLFDDHSLQHAGMYFGRDLRGEWMNLHYHKGLPRDFAPANVARKVPAVTGAALLVRHGVFMAVGGFSESYIIGDYEDSDLCLKLRDAGWDIHYQPQAELFHLERQSIQRHDGYMRGIACLYNRRLHALRWSELMTTLCPGAGMTTLCPEAGR